MSEAIIKQRVFNFGGFNFPATGEDVTLAQAEAKPQVHETEPEVHRVSDRNGHKYACAVLQGRFQWVEDPEEARTNYRYEDAGRLIARSDTMGRTTHYAYNESGYLDAVNYVDGSVLHHEYDDLGKLIKRVLPDGSTMQFTYADENLSTVQFAENDQFTLNYDELGQLSEVMDQGCDTSYTYHQQGEAATITRCIDGVTFTMRYSQEGHVLALELPDASTLQLQPQESLALEAISQDELQYDQMGNVVAIKDAVFVYDRCNQLIEARCPDYGEIRYQYDSAGNRLLRSESEGDTHYSYDQRDRLIQIDRPDGVNTHLKYDAQGKLTDKTDGESHWQYQYNPRQQLVSIQCNGSVVGRYRYDFWGRRISREVGEETALFHYDLLGRVVALTRLDGQPLTTFTYEQSRIVARRFDRSGDPETFYLHTDHLGSTQHISNAEGNTIWQANYSPFGRLLNEAPDFDCPLFTGQLWDSESGLYYFGARYYDPEMARFITTDPWTCGPDDPRIMGQTNSATMLPQSWLTQPRAAHPYLYCLNNPMTFSDPDGLGWGAAVGYFLLFLVWSMPWTLLGLALTLLDWVFQYILFGWAYLPDYGLDGVSSLRLGSFAWVNIGGLLNFPMVLATATFTERGFVDQLSVERKEYIIPEEALTSPRELRPARTAYFEKLLRHTVQTHWWGPFWPFAYLFGSSFWEKDAARQSGFTRGSEPILTALPEKFYLRTDGHLIVIGGDEPLTVAIDSARAGSVGSVAGSAGVFEPGVLFELDDAASSHQTSLDAGSVHNDLRTGFQSSGMTLLAAPSPAVTAVQAGSHWQITHEMITYNIRRRDNTLFVDSARFHEALFKPTYRPGEYKITARDQASMIDERDIEIIKLVVKDIKPVAPTALLVDEISDPRRPTFSLVHHPANATVEIKLNKNEGRIFFDSLPTLVLSTTNGTGDTRLQIRTMAAPPALPGSFAVAHGGAFHNVLNAGNVPAGLSAAILANLGVTLGANPPVNLAPDTIGGWHRWEIIDAGVTYRVRWPEFRVYDNNNLFVTILPTSTFTDLNANNNTAALRAAFRNNGLPFPINSKGVQIVPAAPVTTVTAGRSWNIVSGGVTYTVEADLNFYVTSQLNVATVNDYVHVRPWDNQILFTTPFTAALETSLNSQQNTAALQLVFQNNGQVTLPGSATVLMLQSSREWQVTDDDQGYTISRPAAGGDFQVRPGLKALQVRRMPWITVMVQPHVIRQTNGTSPAWRPRDITNTINATNQIWSQAGIRFQVRGTLFIDNTALQHISVTRTTRQFAAGYTWYNSPDLDTATAWNRAARHTPGNDFRAIHVYFVESISVPGSSGGVVEAFAGGGIPGNWLVMPTGTRTGAFAHELGHNLGLTHPDQESNANLRSPTKRLMHSSALPDSAIIASQDPTRAGDRHDEILRSRQIAATFVGP